MYVHDLTGPVQLAPTPLQLPLVDQLHVLVLRRLQGAGADRLRLVQGPHRQHPQQYRVGKVEGVRVRHESLSTLTRFINIEFWKTTGVRNVLRTGWRSIRSTATTRRSWWGGTAPDRRRAPWFPSAERPSALRSLCAPTRRTSTRAFSAATCSSRKSPSSETVSR